MESSYGGSKLQDPEDSEQLLSAISPLDEPRNNIFPGCLPSVCAAGPDSSSGRTKIENLEEVYKVVIDFCDYEPQEIVIKNVDDGSSIIVTGEHESSRANDPAGVIAVGNEETSRTVKKISFSEKVFFPGPVDLKCMTMDLNERDKILVVTFGKIKSPSPSKENVVEPAPEKSSVVNEPCLPPTHPVIDPTNFVEICENKFKL